MNVITDCSVIIRSVGERTERVCRSLLAEIFPSEHIVVISDVPFAATLRKSLEYGLRAGLPWTFCVDADVLVDRWKVIELFSRARREAQSVFEVHGFVLDKFFNEFRPAGNHLYRTETIEAALQQIPSEGVSPRPETFMIKSLNSTGMRNAYYSDLIVGVHDFEQNYRDIFSKGYLHSEKHLKHLPRLIPNWKMMARSDRDFEVLLWGVAAGICRTADISADKSKVPNEIFSFFSTTLEEKPILAEIGFDAAIVASLISSHQQRALDEPKRSKSLFARVAARVGLAKR